MEQLAPYNPFIGQHLLTHVEGLTVDRAYIAHYIIPAAKATAAGAANVLAATALTTAAQDITTGITQPKTPRVLSITGSAATAVGNVVITGTDAAGAALSETIVSTGAATVVGTKAFATVTKITLPLLASPDGETISVGLAGAFGIPYKLPYDTILKISNGGTATTVASSSFSATVLASNYIVPTAGLNGTQVDVYLIV
ncbi:MAG TPA: hypothetical protein P5539_15410 [Mesotoga sp.]|nr:hypothetical protein [Mesotoga sp.]